MLFRSQFLFFVFFFFFNFCLCLFQPLLFIKKSFGIILLLGISPMRRSWLMNLFFFHSVLLFVVNKVIVFHFGHGLERKKKCVVIIKKE